MRPFWDGHPELARELDCVRETILSRAATDDTEVHGAVRQLLDASGKMLRPAFVLLSSRFGTPDAARMIRIGAAVEMLHMATLVHDDVIDGAPTRRGVATLHVLHGPRKAVLVGDWLFASCFSLIADLAKVDNAQALSRLVARICGSEISQSADRYDAQHEHPPVSSKDRGKDRRAVLPVLLRRGARERMYRPGVQHIQETRLLPGHGLPDHR